MDKVYKILSQLRPEFDFTESKNFIADGYLDSFDIVSLVTELENTFDCIIDALDILPENFDTAEHIVELIKKSKGNI